MEDKREEIKKIIRALIQSAPQKHYEIDDLLRDYKKAEGDHIQYRNYGFLSVEQFLHSFEDFQIYKCGGKSCINCSKNKDSGHIRDLVIHQKKKTANPKRELKDLTKNPDPKQKYGTYPKQGNIRAPSIKDDKYMMSAIPGIAMKRLAEIDNETASIRLPPSNLIETIETDSIIEIAVSEVYSPTEIWFRILNEERHEEFTAMMSDMKNSYSIFFLKRLMPIEEIIKGRNCVIAFGRAFHRATIHGSVCIDMVPVFLLDYGTIIEVDIREIASMEPEYAKLPAQAVKGRLAYVQPLDGYQWSDSVIKHLGDQIFDRRFFAKVVNVEKDKKLLHVVLLDTTTDKFVNINQQLLDLAYADISK